MGGNSSVAAGLVGLAGVLLVGSCVFGGGSDATPTVPKADRGSVVSSVTNATTAPLQASPVDSNANVAKAASIVKDQFFPDQVDKSGSAKYQREWWMIKGAVQQAGYPCAAVAFVQQQFDDTFKAVCKVALHGHKYDAFVINVDTHSVDPISS